jgi:catechol 2,3-dioxygenase-like lactoylglutathione lyase family enzyme
MIGYVTIGTKDLKKAGDFYDKICGELGMGRFMANDRIITWGG